MRTPDFVIVGAAKSGTTSLSNYLAEHPSIEIVSNRLEHFGEFVNPSLGRRTHEEYLKLFQGYPESVLLGEKSVSYLYSSSAPGEIARTCPGVKVIAILRNPVGRAYSDYWHRVRTGVESLTFAEAIEQEERRIAEGARFELHYARYGLYSESVGRYLDVFGRDRVRIFLYDQLTRSPADLCRSCYEFLGVDSGFIPVEFSVHNRGGRGSESLVLTLLNRMARSSTCVSLVRSVVPSTVRTRITGWMREASRTTDYPQMPAEVRRKLLRFYQDDIERLENLIGRDLSHWKGDGPTG